MIVLINNRIQNYPRECIIVLMYKVFFLMVLFITTQILQNVSGKVFIKRLTSVHLNPLTFGFAY